MFALFIISVIFGLFCACAGLFSVVCWLRLVALFVLFISLIDFGGASVVLYWYWMRFGCFVGLSSLVLFVVWFAICLFVVVICFVFA